MKIAQGIDVNQMIRDELETAGPEVDFDTVTRKVAAKVASCDDLESVLFVILRAYVSDVARRVRFHSYEAASSEETPTPVQCRSVGTSRRQQFVHPWKAALESLVVIDEGSGRAKRLGLCTLPDIMTLTSSTARKASDLQRRTKAYEFLAQNLAATKVPTVADLSPAILAAFFKAIKS